MPYDTCQPYLACSSESRDGFCSHVDTSCTAANTCRTCVHGTPRGKNGVCTEINVFPNATIAEYGSYSMFETDRVHKIMAEIYARGPVAAGTLCVFRFFSRTDPCPWSDNLTLYYVLTFCGFYKV